MALSDHFPGFEGWTPATTSVPSAPSPTYSAPGPSQSPVSETPSSPYLRTSLPLPLQYAPDTLKQINRPGLSSFRIAPLPPGGNPSVNAASTSVINSSIQSFITVAAAGPNGAVQYNNGGSLGGAANFSWNNAGSILAINGSLVVTTPIAPAYGGTGSNLSATGGTSEVLLQTSVGGNITVRQLAASDLSNGTTGSGAVVLATAPTINGLTFPTAAGSAVVTQTIASGTAALGTTLIASGSKATTVTVSATGVLATDTLMADFNADPTSTTGYIPSTSGMLTIIKFPSAGAVNFIVVNNTGSGITPGSVTLNFRVVR